MNLSYLNYKILKLNTKLKYLGFPIITCMIAGILKTLYLYVSKQPLQLLAFIAGTSANFGKGLVEEIIFDKIAYPLQQYFLKNVKARNFCNITWSSSAICALILLATSVDIASGLYSEEKALTIPNILAALPFAIGLTISESLLYTISFSFLESTLANFATKAIINPIINSVKWSWSCFTNTDNTSINSELGEQTPLLINNNIETNEQRQLLENHINLEAQTLTCEQLAKIYNFPLPEENIPFNSQAVNANDRCDLLSNQTLRPTRPIL